MARVHTVTKARNEWGCGKCRDRIAKGQPYRWWMFNFSKVKHVRCMKSECTPRGSDLTQSEFFAAISDIEDEFQAALSDFKDGKIDRDDFVSQLDDFAQRIRETGEECQEKFDNLPENFQQGSTGELLEGRANACEEKADELESASSAAQGVDVYDDVAAFIEGESIEREEDETDDEFADRTKSEFEAHTESARDEMASEAESIDFSID